MSVAGKKFEQLARPASPAEEPAHWHEPVSLVALGGGEFSVWCELPRLDPQLDGIPWLVMPDLPGGTVDAARVEPLRRTDTPWWAFEAAGTSASDWASLQDIDLERQIDETLLVADWLNLRQFHVLAGGFSSVTAMTLAARYPERVQSLVLESVFVPLKPVARAYLQAVRRIDATAYDACFARQTDPAPFGVYLLGLDAREQANACRLWQTLEQRLAHSDAAREEGALIRSRRMLAHAFAHDFFMSPNQWVNDVVRISEQSTAVTLVQGLGDRVCPPSGARFLADLLPQSCLLELPDVGHSTDGSLALSALTGAILEHRRPRARLIRLQTVRPK